MYGLLITIGIIISLLYAEKLVDDKKLNKEVYWKMVFWCLILGIVGARLYHVIHRWDLYSKNIFYAFAIWNGGMGIFGGILLALVGIYKIDGKRFFEWTDIFVRVLPLGQAIGRWGNYFNNELLPFALYESFLDTILFLFLNFYSTKKPRRGILSAIYLIGYSIIRIVLEPYRSDHWINGNINITNVVSLGIIFVTLIMVWKTRETEN